MLVEDIFYCDIFLEENKIILEFNGPTHYLFIQKNTEIKS